MSVGHGKWSEVRIPLGGPDSGRVVIKEADTSGSIPVLRITTTQDGEVISVEEVPLSELKAGE